ncbi:hypothetical protein [Lewinella sp. IMCC34191]|uniref:hypothetical protein n=1 Tax=Lewinella sp. IMCC34191 TaxID=2259172 RepID=UPI0013003DF6|nr:hypothetical protein [Lewinella sp. IMCC34191]
MILSKPIYYDKYEEHSLKFNKYLFADSHGEKLLNHTQKIDIYNFSMPSDSYLDMKRKLLFLIRNDVHIDTIFLTVGDHTLSSYREASSNADRSNYFLTSDDYYNTLTYLKDNLIPYYLPFFSPNLRTIIQHNFRNKIRDIFITTLSDSLQNKEWENLSQDKQSKLAKERANKQFGNSQNSKILTAHLLDIINISKNNGIDIIGLKFPLTAVYQEAFIGKGYKADSILINSGYPVLDFTDDLSDSQNFEDQDHLTYEGGKKFVGILKERLVRMDQFTNHKE